MFYKNYFMFYINSILQYLYKIMHKREVCITRNQIRFELNPDLKPLEIEKKTKILSNSDKASYVLDGDDCICEVCDKSKDVKKPCTVCCDRCSNYVKEFEVFQQSYTKNHFLNGLTMAYVHHKNIHLSPDLILAVLIMQISRINSSFKNIFPKKDRVTFHSSDIRDLTKEIIEGLDEYGYNLGTTFSTTSEICRVVTDLLVMEAVSYRFGYVQLICGFPHIILVGTNEDWIKLENHWKNVMIPILLLDLPEKYKVPIENWCICINTILEKMRRSRMGEDLTKFWNEMMSIHPQDPNCVRSKGLQKLSGWISWIFALFSKEGLDLLEKGVPEKYLEITFKDFPNSIRTTELDMIGGEKIYVKAGIFGAIEEDNGVKFIFGFKKSKRTESDYKAMRKFWG